MRDIRVAAAHLAKARALLREQRGAREPQLGVSGSAQYGRLPGPGVPGERRTDLQTGVGLDVAYEVDLFGRISRGKEVFAGGICETDVNVHARARPFRIWLSFGRLPPESSGRLARTLWHCCFEAQHVDRR